MTLALVTNFSSPEFSREKQESDVFQVGFARRHLLSFSDRVVRAVPQVSNRPIELEELRGRLTELSGNKGASVLTWAFQLVAQAQQQGEPVVWVTSTEGSFFPPDVHRMGVDLEALVVIRVPTVEDQNRAADYVLRSGSVGLLVMDFHPQASRKAYRSFPLQVQSRLSGLAQKHGTTVLCLTQKEQNAPSLGSLVSWQAHTQYKRVTGGFYGCAEVIKDKRRGPGEYYAQQVATIPGLY